MQTPYKRLTILVPKKGKTRRALRRICNALRGTFGGFTEKEIYLVHQPANGECQDPKNGKVVLDKHTSIDVDTAIDSIDKINDCIIDIKHLWQKEFCEQEIWMTVQSIYRIE